MEMQSDSPPSSSPPATSDLLNVEKARPNDLFLSDYIPAGVVYSYFSNIASPLEWEQLDRSNATLLDSRGPLLPLFKARWIKAFLRKHDLEEDILVVRIYVLPDDVGRRFIPRDNSVLQKRLGELMNSLDNTLEAWKGERLSTSPSRGYSKEPGSYDSLFYLFNTLPSPSSERPKVACAASQEAIDSILDLDPLGSAGLQTPLHPYQKRSAAAMIRREVAPRSAMDPRLVAAKGPTGKDFFLDCQTGQAFLTPRAYDEVRGGVLAESMGLGKTLISLTTILATKGHWPSVPPEYSTGLHPVRPSTGSLMQMAASAIGRSQIPWRKFFQDLDSTGEEHNVCLQLLEESVGSYKIPPAVKRYGRSPSACLGFVKIRLCSATLVIVPPGLLTQWLREIAMHFAPGTFRVLSLDSKEGAMPPAAQLALYDIILLTRPRFEREMCPTKCQSACICPEYSNCHCPADIEYYSPLRDLHFLRVVMDEGHEFAGGRRNNAYYALERLRVDRKWVVSGTPASGLLGVEVGSSAYGATEWDAGDHSTVLEARRHDLSFAQECKDLESLKIMVTGALDVKPWSNGKSEDAANWNQYITPYGDGRRKPASLRNLLNSLFLRHRIEDVEAEVQLPPLHNQIVYLEPSVQDRVSQNAFLISLISNAVTSERMDEDYMFHPKNRPALQRLINNLRQSGFYWTSFTTEDISKVLDASQKYLDEHPSPTTPAEETDKALLDDVIKVGKCILESQMWQKLSELHEMGMYIDDFPEECAKSWGLAPLQGLHPSLVGVTQLIKIQKWVDHHLYEGPELTKGLVKHGEAVMKRAWENVERTQKVQDDEKHEEEKSVSPAKTPTKKKKKTKKGPSTPESGHPKLTQQLTVSRARSTQAISPSKAKSPSADVESLPTQGNGLKSALKAARPLEMLDPESELSHAILRGTVSSKLSYLLDRVMALCGDEKILIFYDGDHIAYFIAQALDVIAVRYLIYARTLELALKSAYIATFNSVPNFRVMLMNIHEAAHGLHIASASRVFFVNPVWQPNVEAQAIKRAHRIGQIRPVFVETLVLKDTLEEQMLQRRRGMSIKEHQQAEKSLLDDKPMSTIIQNARLLSLPDAALMADPNRQMAPLQHPPRIFGQAGDANSIDPANPYADLIFPMESARTRKLGIQKATDEQLSAPVVTTRLNKRLFEAVEQQQQQHNGHDEVAPSSSRPASSSSPRPGKKRVGFA